jgi:hypothetical protein
MSTTLDGVTPPHSARGRLLSLAAERAMPWMAAAAIALAVGISLVDTLPVGVVHDDGMYVLLAKSLATGQGYRWIHLPGAPPATHFPPGYPAFLALLWLIAPAFPGNVVLFKLANACLAAVSAAVCVNFVRERFEMSSAGAIAFSIGCILGIPMLTLNVMVMSEPLFLALLLPILLYAERVTERDVSRRRDIILLAVATGIATLVRTHGIALIAAVPVVLVVRRRRFADAALFLGIAIAVLLPWQLWSSAHTGFVPEALRGNYESYGAWLVGGLRTEGVGLLWRTAHRTSVELAAMFATLAAPGLGAFARLLALGSLALLTVVGARPLVRRAPVAALFLVFYSGIVILWPFTPARFAWAVWPLLILIPVLGAREILRWKPATRPLFAARVAALVLASALALGHGLYTIRGYRGRWWSSIPRAGAANLGPLVLWAARRTAPTDVLAVEAEGAVYLYAGRQTVPVHTFTVQQYFMPRTAEQEASVISALLESYRVNAVAVTTPRMREAAGLLASRRPPLLTLRDSFPGGIVLTPTRR